MSVATWLKSVFTTQTATNYKTNIDACFAVAERIVDNFAPRQSNTPAMTVTLDAGALYNGQTLTEVAAQTTGTITAPVGNPRIDRVVIDKTTGVVSVITGTPAGSPVAPALTGGVFPVARVLLQTTSTTIVNSMITDERTASLVSVGAHIAAAPNKATPVGADTLGLLDSVTGLLNKLTLTNLLAYLVGALVPTNATNATNLTNSGTISATATGGASLTPTLAVNAVPKDVGSGGVGMIAWLNNNSGGSVAAGATVAGSGLLDVTNVSTALSLSAIAYSGTWRNISGRNVASGTLATTGVLGMFQRIS